MPRRSNDLIEPAVEAILNTARTGKIGDGKAFISRIDNAIGIRNEQRGMAAR